MISHKVVPSALFKKQFVILGFSERLIGCNELLNIEIFCPPVILAMISHTKMVPSAGV